MGKNKKSKNKNKVKRGARPQQLNETEEIKGEPPMKEKLDSSHSINYKEFDYSMDNSAATYLKDLLEKHQVGSSTMTTNNLISSTNKYTQESHDDLISPLASWKT